MSLPWFSFNSDDYLGNTLHLTTEEHGAYLLLMLSYYRTGKPLPGYDRALAAIAKLPIDRWMILKVGIEPFFIADNGVWKHERIEKELLAASSKHATAVARAKAAAAAKYSKDAPSIPQAEPKPTRSKKTPPSQPVVSFEHAPSTPEASSSSPHLHKHTTLSSSSSSREDDDNPTKVIEDSGKEDFNPLGATLPADWTPGDAEIAVAVGYGMDDEAVRAELLLFHAYNAQNGTFSKNWSATWRMWCARWKEREAAKPKPRVEVNTTSAPTPENWDRACALWAKGTSTWARKSLGPEPGQVDCKCPNIFLTKHNIDPETGRVVAPSKETVS